MMRLIETKIFLIILLLSLIQLILSEELKNEGRKLSKNFPTFHNFHERNEQKQDDESLIESKNVPRNYDNTDEDDVDVDRDDIVLKPKKPLKNIFMGIYKNYKATYLGNRTSSEYTKSLTDSTDNDDLIKSKHKKKNSNQLNDNETDRISNKKKKKKKNKSKKNKGSVTKKDEALLHSYDGEYRYNIGPGVNVSLDMKKDIVNVNLDEDNLKDVLLGRWDDFENLDTGLQSRGCAQPDAQQPQEYLENLDHIDQLEQLESPEHLEQLEHLDHLEHLEHLKPHSHDHESNRNKNSRGKKYEMITKILPLFILPFLIQSAVIPFLVTKLKILLINSILIGKLAIFLIIISALKNQQKTQTYEASPSYWASEPSRRSEVYNGGYRVEGRPTTWVT